MGDFDLAAASNLELIVANRRTLAELKERGLIRTDSLVGEFGEYLAAAMYGVRLSKVGQARLDLRDQEGRLVQVKTRTADDYLSGKKFMGLGKGGFDVCLFIFVDPITFRPNRAREVPMSRLADLLDARGNIGCTKVRNEGVDRLSDAIIAYEAATAVLS